MLNYPAIYLLSERERAVSQMQGTVFTLATYLSKIENSSYYQELKGVDKLFHLGGGTETNVNYHITCQHVTVLIIIFIM